MSMEMLSGLSSSLKIGLNAEKDAGQKKAEEVASDAFAAALAQADNAASNVTTFSGLRSNAIIPAALVDLAAKKGLDVSTGQLAEGSVKAKDPTETFLEFASKTPAEKMRALVLGEMGLTEEDLANLSAEERAELEAKIQTRIEAKVKQEIEKKSGFMIVQQ